MTVCLGGLGPLGPFQHFGHDLVGCDAVGQLTQQGVTGLGRFGLLPRAGVRHSQELLQIQALGIFGQSGPQFGDSLGV